MKKKTAAKKKKRAPKPKARGVWTINPKTRVKESKKKYKRTRNNNKWGEEVKT